VLEGWRPVSVRRASLVLMARVDAVDFSWAGRDGSFWWWCAQEEEDVELMMPGKAGAYVYGAPEAESK
jgi:hypothetical protein